MYDTAASEDKVLLLQQPQPAHQTKLDGAFLATASSAGYACRSCQSKRTPKSKICRLKVGANLSSKNPGAGTVAGFA